jgi:hypothetical protein
MRCGQCGLELEKRCSIANRANQTCPECEDSLLTPLISGARTIGITHSKPVVSEQLGRTFETNSQLRAYEKQNGGEWVDKNDSYVVRMKDRARNACDVTARRLGYRDHDHRVQVRKKERAEGKANTPQIISG